MKRDRISFWSACKKARRKAPFIHCFYVKSNIKLQKENMVRFWHVAIFWCYSNGCSLSQRVFCWSSKQQTITVMIICCHAAYTKALNAHASLLLSNFISDTFTKCKQENRKMTNRMMAADNRWHILRRKNKDFFIRLFS